MLELFDKDLKEIIKMLQKESNYEFSSQIENLSKELEVIENGHYRTENYNN